MIKTCSIIITMVILLSLSAIAENKEPISQKELLRRIDILSEEINNIKNGSITSTDPQLSQSTKSNSNLSIGGYGELLYQNYAAQNESNNASDKNDTIDMLRAVFYVGYNFSDNILMRSEIEIEHGSEIFVEQLYLDFIFNKKINLRAGLLLAPMGFINEAHEPPLFFGSTRPLTEQYIIPTTWREIGAGLYGAYAFISYRLYAVNSFKGAEFSGNTGTRGGRQKGIEATAEDFALIGRIDIAPYDYSLLGFSVYYGNTGQEQDFNATTSIFDAHAQLKVSGLQVRLLYSIAFIKDAAKINALDETGETSVGKELRGWYIEAGYNIFNLFGLKQQLVLFGRYEWLNTQYKTPEGYNADQKNNQRIITAGLSYKPVLHVVIKGDYQWVSNKATTGVNQFNLALGYMF